VLLLFNTFFLLLDFDSWGAAFALSSLDNNTLLTFAKFAFDSRAFCNNRLNLRIIRNFSLHICQVISILIDSLHFIIEFLLLFEIAHFITISLILEIFGPVFFGQ
jgi:hypothetical protein